MGPAPVRKIWQRFRTEAEAIARLQHPHIVQIFEVGEHDHLPFFALEYCAGGSLGKKLAGTPLPPLQAAALLEKLARAMHAAHLKGILHRDLKPGNVLLQEVASCQLPVVSEDRDAASSLTTDNWQLTTPKTVVSKDRNAASPLATENWQQTTTPKITDFGLAKKLDEAGKP